MSKNNDDIIVTSAQLGLLDVKPRVTVEITVEEAQKLEIQRLHKVLADMKKDMEDRNDLMRAKLFYEQERETYLGMIQDMQDAFEETGFDASKLSNYSQLSVKRVSEFLNKKNQEGNAQ